MVSTLSDVTSVKKHGLKKKAKVLVQKRLDYVTECYSQHDQHVCSFQKFTQLKHRHTISVKLIPICLYNTILVFLVQ